MKTPWLIAAAALTLSAGAVITYAAEPQDTERQAAEDARSAAQVQRGEARAWRDQVRRDRDVVYYRRGDPAQNLTDMLQLRADQQGALKAFLDATRPERMHDHMANLDRVEAEGRGTLAKLDEMQARMAQQQAEANRKIAAIKAFYAQLDDKQRKAFDALPMLMVVGPSIGPMMIPHALPVVERMPPMPPAPPHS